VGGLSFVFLGDINFFFFFKKMTEDTYEKLVGQLLSLYNPTFRASSTSSDPRGVTLQELRTELTDKKTELLRQNPTNPNLDDELGEYLYNTFGLLPPVLQEDAFGF
jgi:hypothetical protein